jgi:SAM-dependent methyltransferase
MDNTNLYENFDWSQLNYQSLIPKIKKILEIIPKDTRTIIDIGCGDGKITNVLNEHYDVTAVDRSTNALKYVKTKKILSPADNIPVSNNSFDMVFSSEMIEHLDDNTLNGAINEFKRISRKYIFITVPNDENPDKLAIKCPKCNYIYNRPNHLQSFNINRLKKLFPEYKILNTFPFGPKTRYYNKYLLKFKLKYTPANSWVPYYWIPKTNRNTFCPNCEHSFKFTYSFNPLSFTIDMVNIVLSRKKPYWLFVLMEKN